MNLIKSNPVEKLPAHYREYIQATNSKSLAECHRADNLKAIYGYIVESMALAGLKQSDDGQALKFISEQLYNELMVKFRNMKHGELRLAFRKGVLKEFGEYFGINVQTCYNWVKSYYSSEELKRAKVEFNRILDEESGVKKSDVPLVGFEVPKESILSLFKEFKEGKPLPSYSRIYYDAILKIKGVKTLINDTELRIRIKDEAKQEYGDSLGKKGIRLKEPEKYALLMNSFDKDSKTFESLTKKLALKYYFHECIKEGKNVID